MFEKLVGEELRAWAGCELAADASEQPVTWTLQNIPFRQFFEVEIELKNDRLLKVESVLDDNGDYELRVSSKTQRLELYEPRGTDFVRVTEIRELPVGVIRGGKILHKAGDKVIGVSLTVENEEVSLQCGLINKEATPPKLTIPEDFVLVGKLGGWGG